MPVSHSSTGLTRVVQLGFVNAYLLEEDDELTLVDTGAAGHARKILSAVSALKKPLTRIVLTHAHADHVGSLDKIAAANPEAEILISARDARLLAGDMSLNPDEAKSKIRGGFKKVKTAPTTLIHDGDRIGSLTVVDAPGHTPGHVALFRETDGLLLCGDAFTTFAGVETTALMGWRFPLATSATWDRPTELRSARKLAQLNPTAIAPGHGPVLSEPTEAIAAALTRAEAKLAA